MLEKGLKLIMVFMRGSIRSLKEFILYLDNYVRGRFLVMCGLIYIKIPHLAEARRPSIFRGQQGGEQGRKIFVMMHCGAMDRNFTIIA